MSSKKSQVRAIPWSERRAHTREQLVTAAWKVISEKGFQQATLDEIAARAGLTKGAVYDNFATKDELFLAVVMAWATERGRRFGWPKERSGTVSQRLRRLAEAVIVDAPAAQLEAPLRAEFLLYTLTHEAIRKRVAVAAVSRMTSVREHLREFLSDDELRLPLEKFTLLLEALIPGLMFIRAQAPNLVTDDDIFAIFESLAGRTKKD